MERGRKEWGDLKCFWGGSKKRRGSGDFIISVMLKIFMKFNKLKEVLVSEVVSYVGLGEEYFKNERCSCKVIWLGRNVICLMKSKVSVLKIV